MAIKVQVPPTMRQHTDNQGVVELEGATVGEVLAALSAKYPATAGKILDKGALRRTLNVILNDEDIRTKGGLNAPVKDGDTLAVIPHVSGGEDEEEEPGEEVPDGAAVFPEIPDDLGVNPLLLASLHATI
ncbi:MAG: MoaD family protein, partial [Gemmataceae bacterium]|nr:MoaD family protein [Gemmataceae bacterium]